MIPSSTYTQDIHSFQMKKQKNRQETSISWWPPILAVTWRGHGAKRFHQGNKCEGDKDSVA